MQLTNGTVRIESLDMLASETRDVFVDRVLAERDGRRLDVRLLLHVTILGGQIVEGVDYFHPERAWDAFWA